MKEESRMDATLTARFSRVVREDAEQIVKLLQPQLRRLAGTTLLVTGGSGFLCSYFFDTIATFNDTAGGRPCRMLCVDNLKSGLAQRLAHLFHRGDFRFIEHDISRPLDPGEDVQWIVHGASIASPTFYRRYPLETIDVNVSGTRHMLELARQRGARSMLYLSSSEIYGNPPPDRIPTPETYVGSVSCTGPRACYDESKRLGETLCTVYHRLHRLPVKTVRPFNVYGPGQRLDDRRVIPDLIADALAQQPLTILSDGRATRSFCYVADVIQAMWHVLLSDCDGEAFNVGNDAEEVTIEQVAGRLQQVAGDPPLDIRYRHSADADYLTDNPERRCPDLTKMRRAFGWAPRVTLTQGLGRTLAHCREVQQHAARDMRASAS
jgi:dTDP-glucose 4,6-dehydratase/UDP-glucuronate decarboxylase